MGDQHGRGLELPENGSRLEPVHDRHAQVEHYRVEARLRCRPDGIQAVMGGAGLVSLEL